MTKRSTVSTVSKAVLLLLVFGITGGAQAADPECTFPNEIIDMGHLLHRTSRPIGTDRPLTIVALGSSSTAGAGASKSEASYPTRLRGRLSSLLGRPVIVVNGGRNGDRVGDMVFRLPTEVLPERPDVVIWQLGTNALLTDLNRDDFGSLFSRGVREIARSVRPLCYLCSQRSVRSNFEHVGLRADQRTLASPTEHPREHCAVRRR
jgi:acyl-CoA thioesterase I